MRMAAKAIVQMRVRRSVRRARVRSLRRLRAAGTIVFIEYPRLELHAARRIAQKMLAYEIGLQLQNDSRDVTPDSHTVTSANLESPIARVYVVAAYTCVQKILCSTLHITWGDVRHHE